MTVSKIINSVVLISLITALLSFCSISGAECQTRFRYHKTSRNQHLLIKRLIIITIQTRNLQHLKIFNNINKPKKANHTNVNNSSQHKANNSSLKGKNTNNIKQNTNNKAK